MNDMESVLEKLSDRWVELEGDDPSEFKVPIKVELAFKKFVNRLEFSEIIEAIELTHDRLEDHRTKEKLRYFCGICWRKIGMLEFKDGGGI